MAGTGMPGPQPRSFGYVGSSVFRIGLFLFITHTSSLEAKVRFTNTHIGSPNSF